jgi:DNA-binding transcriptional regulator YiaG
MTPLQIKQSRKAAQLTVAKAAFLTGLSQGRIKSWEAQAGAKHSRKPCPYALRHYLSFFEQSKLYD